MARNFHPQAGVQILNIYEVTTNLFGLRNPHRQGRYPRGPGSLHVGLHGAAAPVASSSATASIPGRHSLQTT
jgi:hypothetical protein